VSSKRPAPPAPEPLAPLIDAHTHLDACGATNAASVTAIVDRAAAVGVEAVVTIADDLASARWATEAADWAEQQPDPRVLSHEISFRWLSDVLSLPSDLVRPNRTSCVIPSHPSRLEAWR